MWFFGMTTEATRLPTVWHAAHRVGVPLKTPRW
jgi:hypothetical protein